MFACMECGRKFRGHQSAERAFTHGCPSCGGTDIDIYSTPVTQSRIRVCKDELTAEKKRREISNEAKGRARKRVKQFAGVVSAAKIETLIRIRNKS